MNAVIDRVDSSFRVAQLEDRAAQQTLEMATSLISLLDLRDRYTGGHSSRVASYCREISLQMDLGHEETETIVMAAALHDIGKIGVPDHVLLKPGSLTDEEFEWIRKHPEFGWIAVRNVDGFEQAGMMILHHHERWDGRGYPGNLRNTEIPFGATVITVADSFDALTTDRPYRKGYSQDDAIREIVRCSGTHFNPDVVKAFCDCLR